MPQEEMLLNMDQALKGVNPQGANLNVPQEEILLNMDHNSVILAFCHGHKALVAKEAILMCHKKKCY